MMYLFTLIYDVLVYSQIIHSTNPNPMAAYMWNGLQPVTSFTLILNPNLTLSVQTHVPPRALFDLRSIH